MKIVLFSNYLNHHQIPFAESMNAIDGIEFIFVSVSGVPEFRKKLGYLEYEKPYLLEINKNNQNKRLALNLAREADVAIFTPTKMEEYIIPRLQSDKLTFECSERWFKKDFGLNIFSPNLWKHQSLYYRYGRKANLYMLCSSAYAANDYYRLGSFKNKCFKWAYFTDVCDIDIESILASKRGGRMQIMWCSRLISWKHPELAIKVAKRLIKEGYVFDLNMYGNGPLSDTVQAEINKLELTDYIHLKGNARNTEILNAMQKHNIFLFTSDQNEGWGAVANESMSNGCAIIGSSMIGSIPYLVRNCENGMIFKSKNVNSLYQQLKYLLDNPDKCEKYARTAYYDMKKLWSPKVAAERFVTLINNLSNGQETPFEQGPCSKAFPTKMNATL